MVTDTCLRYVVIVCIFLRNRVFHLRQKYSADVQLQFLWPMLGNEFFIIRQPVNFFTKNDTPVNFSQVFSQFFQKL